MESESHDRGHPTPKLYVQIALILAVLTAIEVGLFYIEEAGTSGRIVYPLLIVLALLKFILVIAFYMHLKYEKGTLSRLFAGGFLGALMLYLVVLGTFGFFAIAG